MHGMNATLLKGKPEGIGSIVSSLNLSARALLDNGENHFLWISF